METTDVHSRATDRTDEINSSPGNGFDRDKGDSIIRIARYSNRQIKSSCTIFGIQVKILIQDHYWDVACH